MTSIKKLGPKIKFFRIIFNKSGKVEFFESNTTILISKQKISSMLFLKFTSNNFETNHNLFLKNLN